MRCNYSDMSSNVALIPIPTAESGLKPQSGPQVEVGGSLVHLAASNRHLASRDTALEPALISCRPSTRDD